MTKSSVQTAACRAEAGEVRSSESGFSLVEVLVATSVLTVALAGLAQLFTISIRANSRAHAATYTSVSAQQKMEQLRGLAYGFGPFDLPLVDTTTDLSASPEAPDGGSGLLPSPPGTLTTNTPGYVDYLDANGSPFGGASPESAPGTAYVRRWSVEPLPADPDNAIVLQVRVTRAPVGAATTGNVTRVPGEARLVTIKARRAR